MGHLLVIRNATKYSFSCLPPPLSWLFAWAGSRAEESDAERGGEMTEQGEGKEEFAARL